MGYGAKIPGQRGSKEKIEEGVAHLAKSEDARRLLELLKQEGGVDQAAREAAQGRPQQLMELMGRLMETQEGAKLVARIQRQAKESGLE